MVEQFNTRREGKSRVVTHSLIDGKLFTVNTVMERLETVQKKSLDSKVTYYIPQVTEELEKALEKKGFYLWKSDSFTYSDAFHLTVFSHSQDQANHITLNVSKKNAKQETPDFTLFWYYGRYDKPNQQWIDNNNHCYEFHGLDISSHLIELKETISKKLKKDQELAKKKEKIEKKAEQTGLEIVERTKKLNEKIEETNDVLRQQKQAALTNATKAQEHIEKVTDEQIDEQIEKINDVLQKVEQNDDFTTKAHEFLAEATKENDMEPNLEKQKIIEKANEMIKQGGHTQHVF